jgi:hypothetical protein
VVRIVFKTKDGSLIMNRKMDDQVFELTFVPRWFKFAMQYNSDNYPDWTPTEEQIKFLNYDAREKGVKIIKFSVNSGTINALVDYL